MEALCHICRSMDIEEGEGFSDFWRVSSDSRPFRRNGRLGVCRHCGLVQKIVDEPYRRECAEIYGSYAVYQAGGGQEQYVFASGCSKPRSEFILAEVARRVGGFPEEGRLLDVGCGNGNLLRAFSKIRSAWRLNGFDLDDRHHEQMRDIGNIEGLYAGDLKNVPGRFSLISVLHTLEHIIDPIGFLKTVSEKLEPGGALLIEVPDFTSNPFDLIIADHCTHFDQARLTYVFGLAGFSLPLSERGLVPKELTFLARRNDSAVPVRQTGGYTESCKAVESACRWLRGNVDKARNLSGASLGVFGTSNAGLWLFSEVRDRISFFVDEDPSRIGKSFFNRPVYHPDSVPTGSHVYIAMPYAVAQKVMARMDGRTATYHLPPRMDS